MTLMRVRLELARSPEFPEGSAARGYEFTAPLTKDGSLDAAEWKANALACTVRRFWEGEPDEHGVLAHRRGAWSFDYDPKKAEDDEPIFKLDRHTIRQGDYLSITEHDGVTRTFKVMRMSPRVR
jgi:hypothetical protein